MNYTLKHGNSLQILKEYPDNYFDSVVTDPPYHLVSNTKKVGKSNGFMGKEWDGVDENGIGIAQNVELWKEVYRVLKPGGHMLSFSGTRTYHRMTCAIEDAGFDIRDMVSWVYGSGFPKSHNIEKSVKYLKGSSLYEGWGTALKPAVEPICLARKPLSENTVAENMIKHGTGGINIDASRVEVDKGTYGRWPANFIHDGSDEVVELFPNVKGSKGSGLTETKARSWKNTSTAGINRVGYEDTGSAARFFYSAKVNKSERNIGLTKTLNNHPTVKPMSLMQYLIKMITPPGGKVLDPFNGSGSTGAAAVGLGYEYVGIDLDKDYLEISRQRIEGWLNVIKNNTSKKKTPTSKVKKQKVEQTTEQWYEKK